MTFYDSLGVFKVTFDQTSYFRPFCVFHPGGSRSCLVGYLPKSSKSSKLAKNRKMWVQKIEFSTSKSCFFWSRVHVLDSGAKIGSKNPIKKKSSFSRKKNASGLQTVHISPKWHFWDSNAIDKNLFWL